MARGDQIYVMREFINIKGIYEHHGIDCGDGTVIHYRKPQATVERTSLATFTQGQKVYVKNYQTSYIPDVAVRRAESRLGEKTYNLLFNNCEHFANWCKTGVNDSLQVKDFLPLLSYIQIDTLSQPLQDAISEAGTDKTAHMVSQALADIRIAWDNIQPQYKELVEETNVWDRVAREALKQKREDLARRAIQRKLKHKQRAKELETQLSKLAEMTETLIKNRPKGVQITP